MFENRSKSLILHHLIYIWIFAPKSTLCLLDNWGHLRLLSQFEVIWGFWGHLRSFDTFWGHLRLLRSSKTVEVIWGYWGHLRLLRSFKTFWAHLRLLRSSKTVEVIWGQISRLNYAIMKTIILARKFEWISMSWNGHFFEKSIGNLENSR